jgi:hypothetical protein
MTEIENTNRAQCSVLADMMKLWKVNEKLYAEEIGEALRAAS